MEQQTFGQWAFEQRDATACAEARRERSRLAAEIIGESPVMCSLRRELVRVAPLDSTVLLTGETGVGKGLAARALHRLSGRRGGPWIHADCSALSPSLIESELFGHERGAFTGADRRRIGRFEEANGGTLMLDEIGEVSPAIQVKLLRVLQEQEFQRVGGTHTLRTDARIVAATNSLLEDRVAAGEFREDLYFRLNVIRIHLPPLRERPEDLVDLAHHFLREFRAAMDLSVEGFSDGALAQPMMPPG